MMGREVNPKKIVTVVGARPQFVKAAVVSRAIADVDGVTEVMVHTGQHFDSNMSEIFFTELEIPVPKYNLGIGGGTHGANTGRALEAVESVIQSERAEMVVVYGDTDATLAGALAAAKLHIPVAHIEAGLRSFNRKMPEEINRILTDHVSGLLFAPSQTAVENLSREGIAGNSVRMVGDVMRDAVEVFTEVAEGRSRIIQTLSLKSKCYVLATLHRQENTDDANRLRNIFQGLGFAEMDVILPLHPRTKKRIAEFGLAIPSNIRVIDPVGYFDMLLLERHARSVATDSGGVQKEAYFHGVQCVTLRDETEWVELVDIGANRLTGSDPKAIAAALTTTPTVGFKQGVYGTGNSSAQIAAILAEF